MHKIFMGIALATTLLLAACERPADVASRNLSYAADNYEVNRKIVLFNGITDSYLLEVEGYCALGNHDATRQLSFTCQVGKGVYKKFFLGLSDNVSYLVQDLAPQPVNTYRYRVNFQPSHLIPIIGMD